MADDSHQQVISRQQAVDFDRQIIEEFRRNGGRVGGRFEGASLVLLTTTGAKTGRPRTTPAAYLREGGRIFVFATNAGSDRHPAWYHNLLAHPRITFEIGGGRGVETRAATAVVLHGEERDRVYARQAAIVPAFAAYQEGTSRVIPVVALDPVDHERARRIGDDLAQIHAGLRRDLAAARGELEEFLTGRRDAPPHARLGTDLRDHCLAFCEALHKHHSREDETGFPILERQYPELRPALERLRREHVAVADAVHRLRTLLADPGASAPERVRAEFDRLSDELESHFAYEEEQLTDALNALVLEG
ncbi:nitroreductase/quinone reductase family protein [Planobispora siamensis]|uniref:Cation-binding protein n=1 Tax=Planobispora siamensis TaxID=936338 RepID=A0A8J3SK95_9ACTN|nr:nitroreductase/quinone reductase family protein [Planobispora siamensis]GIH93955.1 cation-binding protein [Planobispora siamensis]